MLSRAPGAASFEQIGQPAPAPALARARARPRARSTRAAAWREKGAPARGAAGGRLSVA